MRRGVLTGLARFTTGTWAVRRQGARFYLFTYSLPDIRAGEMFLYQGDEMTSEEQWRILIIRADNSSFLAERVERT